MEARSPPLSLAYLCALQGRLAEARRWFAEARKILDEQGARPLRAIVDFDEAWALVRATGLKLTDPAFPPTVRSDVDSLFDAAHTQFEAIGMPGWIRWVGALRRGRSDIEPAARYWLIRPPAVRQVPSPPRQLPGAIVHYSSTPFTTRSNNSSSE